MPMIRYDVRNEDIASALRGTEGNIQQAADRLGCGDGLIHRWLQGVREEPEDLSRHLAQLTPENVCTCCGIRERSGRFLCGICFTTVENGQVYPETRVCYA